MKSEEQTLHELITEAHQVMKDLRGLIREAGEVSKTMVELVQAEQRAALEEMVVPIIETFVADFRENVDRIDEMIEKRYQEVFLTILDREGRAPKEGESPEDAVKRVVRERGWM